MQCTIVLEFDDGDGGETKRVELMRFHRTIEEPTPGDVGLSLAEGKSLVNCVQQEFVVEQITCFCTSRRACPTCGVLRRLHDSHCSELKTTLGKVFYCRDRWKACDCGADASRWHCQVDECSLRVWIKRSYPYQITRLDAVETVQSRHVARRSFSMAR